jgi:hypothetical protein
LFACHYRYFRLRHLDCWSLMTYHVLGLFRVESDTARAVGLNVSLNEPHVKNLAYFLNHYLASGVCVNECTGPGLMNDGAEAAPT